MSGVLQSPMKPPVRLWRIEHPVDGIGPFQPYDWQQGWRPHLRMVAPWDQDGRTMPSPWDMPIPRLDRCLRGECGTTTNRTFVSPVMKELHGHLKFAFTDLKGLLRWWPGWALDDIAKKGYVVKTVSVPWDAHARWSQQARYDDKRATTLRTLSPVDVLWA